MLSVTVYPVSTTVIEIDTGNFPVKDGQHRGSDSKYEFERNGFTCRQIDNPRFADPRFKLWHCTKEKQGYVDVWWVQGTPEYELPGERRRISAPGATFTSSKLGAFCDAGGEPLVLYADTIRWRSASRDDKTISTGTASGSLSVTRADLCPGVSGSGMFSQSGESEQERDELQVSERRSGQQAYEPPASLVSDVRGYAAETSRGAVHVERWNRVLIGLGAETFDGLSAMKASEAQTFADRGWPRWIPVAAELQNAEDAASQPPPPPPPPTPELSITGGAGVTEGAGAVFTITADPATTAQLSVSVNVTQSGDFANVGARTVIIPANSTSVTVWVSTIDDAIDEPDGSVTATLQSGTGYNVGASSSATIAVSDNDDPAPPPPPPPPDPELTISGGAGVTEGTDVVFTITASPAATSSLTVNLSASQSGDFASSLPSTVTLSGGTATLRIATVNDSTDESDGSITVALTSGSGYTVGASSSATVAVSDNDDPPPPPKQSTLSEAELIAEMTALRDAYYARTGESSNHFLVWYRADDTLTALTGGSSMANNPNLAKFHFQLAIASAWAVGDADAADLFAQARDFLGSQ